MNKIVQLDMSKSDLRCNLSKIFSNPEISGIINSSASMICNIRYIRENHELDRKLCDEMQECLMAVIIKMSFVFDNRERQEMFSHIEKEYGVKLAVIGEISSDELDQQAKELIEKMMVNKNG